MKKTFPYNYVVAAESDSMKEILMKKTFPFDYVMASDLPSDELKAILIHLDVLDFVYAQTEDDPIDLAPIILDEIVTSYWGLPQEKDYRIRFFYAGEPEVILAEALQKLERVGCEFR